jgi:hypothetical protein
MVRHMVRIKRYEIPFLVPHVAIASHQIAHSHRLTFWYPHFIAWHFYPTVLSVIRVKVYDTKNIVRFVVFYWSKLNIIGEVESTIVLSNLVNSCDELL